MMKPDLFVVESPFQLLCAIEAREHFHSENPVLVVRYSLDQKNNEQIDSILALVTWPRVQKIMASSHMVYFDAKLMAFLAGLKRRKSLFRYIFIGEYRSWVQTLFAKNLACEKVFLLDDGNGVISLQASYLPSARIYPIRRAKLLLYQSLALLMRLSWSVSPIINLFTTFDLQPFAGQEVINNRFQFLSQMLLAKPVKKNTVFFFGSNLSGQHVISEEYEFEMLKAVCAYYAAQGLELFYIPHRREEAAKVARIASETGMAIREFRLPAELEIIYLEWLPGKIASFYSNAISGLSRLHDFDSVDAFYLQPAEINPVYREAIEAVYEDYRNKFNVVDLADKGRKIC